MALELDRAGLLGKGDKIEPKGMNNRKIVRIHQNVLVFYKGNPKEIKNHFEPLEVLENDLETLLESLEE